MPEVSDGRDWTAAMSVAGKTRSPAPRDGDAGLMATIPDYGCAGASDGATERGGCEGPKLAEPPGPPGPPWKPAAGPWP